VLLAEGDEARKLAELYPGALVGEAALLTGAPRNATVLAVEDSALLRLRREDFLETLAADRRAAATVLQQWRLRDRPRRIEG
jgi:CRP-like cAMP-binding protein